MFTVANLRFTLMEIIVNLTKANNEYTDITP